MIELDFCVITFYSTHLALQFEKLIKGSGLRVKLIPVPRKISSSCGIAGRISPKDLTVVRKICQEKGLAYDSVYRIFNDQTKQPELVE